MEIVFEKETVALNKRVVEALSGTKPIELKRFNATFSLNAPRWCCGFESKKIPQNIQNPPLQKVIHFCAQP
eukprot:1157799-Pelagomonas_calceolata.AAC.14